ncbi:hypothetical protein C8Q78DRAFT_1074620 [Trametes maxima]|nr:hypothetical protein C8Q78DRAFT_1074620 [Trametes maxima]
MRNGAGLVKRIDFPAELLLAVRELFDPADLRTHVCFYLSSPRVAMLYDASDNPDAFWRRACWSCGIGAAFAPEENSDSTLWPLLGATSWKEVAIDCISRDGFCKHPQCGEVLLEYNRQRMREAATYLESFKPLRITESSNSLAPLSAHPIFGHIEFRRVYDAFLERDAQFDVHLRRPGAPTRRVYEKDYMCRHDEYPGLYLMDHPLAARSFATSTPIATMMLLQLCGRTLRNSKLNLPRAVTVFDVVCAMHAELDSPLTVYDACEHIDCHEYCFPKEWSLGTAFKQACNIRSILSICPIETLEYEENTASGPAFSFRQM